MITKFNQFLLESRGFADAMKPYTDMVYDRCLIELDKYLNTKGKFFNRNVLLEFDWDDIKKYVTPETYTKFPVVTINVTFKINVMMTPEFTNSGSYYPVDDVYSTDIKSVNIFVGDDNWNKDDDEFNFGDSFKLLFDIGIVIPKSAISIDIERTKSYIKQVINHEFTHAYEDYKKENRADVEDVLSNFTNKLFEYDLSKNIPLYEFFRLIQISIKKEVRAITSEVFDKDSYNKVMEDVKLLKDFDVEEKISDVTKEFKNMGYPDTKDFYNDFGNLIVELYTESCEEMDVKPLTKMLKLKGKNMKEVFTFYKKIFNDTAEYLQRKIDKRLPTE